MFGALALGVSLVAISSRSERAMFQSGLPMPGVFATIGTDLTENPRISLRDRDPAAFFARLDPGVDELAPEPEEEGASEPLERALVFVGPEAELPAQGPTDIVPLGMPEDPQLAYNPQVSLPPETGDVPFFRTRLTDPLSSTGGSSTGGGSSSGGGSSTGGDGGSSSGGGSSGGTPATPVPEPSTWVMLLTGFIAVGSALRLGKRRQRAFTH